jgi:hypothetical protein
MQNSLIQRYLSALRFALLVRGIWDPHILEEIQGHLADAVEHSLARGLDRAAAEEQAISRLGPAGAVAAGFLSERITRMQTVLLLAGAVMGGLIAYIDSRPTWDDTGITAFALLIAAGLLGLVSPRRPWKWALAVGIWLPLVEMILSHQAGILLVLIIPFIGAYAGAGVNWAIRHTLHPA